MYERPIQIDSDTAARRIFSPLAYPAPRNTPIVPVAHVEAARLASWFPIVWHRREDKIELVTVRSMLADGSGHPPGSLHLLTLPLLLQAYPFLLNAERASPSDPPFLVDDAVADAPSDIGAPIAMPGGKASRATELRFQALRGFATALVLTEKMSARLAELGLFEAWKFTFDVEGQTVGRSDLLVVAPAAFDTGRLSPFLGEFGSAAAQLLGLHRVSLFRAGALLASARAALQAARKRSMDEGTS